jgi:hypothetical protein
MISYKAKGISYEEKHIIIIKPVNDDGTYTVFDGKKEYKMDKNERETIYKDPINSKFKLIPYKPELKLDKNGQKQKMTIVEYYDHFIMCADALKEATKNMTCRINIYKTGKFSTTSLHLFYSLLNKYNKRKIKNNEESRVIHAEDIEFCETRFLHNVCGGLMYGKEYKGKLYKYDVVSFYPSIMKDSHFLIPIKKRNNQHNNPKRI